MRKNNLNLIIFGHLNINSLRNKFDLHIKEIKEYVDVLVISETKLGNAFLEGQFRIPGFTPPFRKNQNQFGGGFMVFIKEDIPGKLLFTERVPVKTIFIELYSRKKKRPLCCAYNPVKLIYQITWMCHKGT